MLRRELIRPAIGIAVATVLSLIPCEIALRIFGKSLEIKTYGDLRGQPYPAAPSSYLPFTTSPGMMLGAAGSEPVFAFNRFGYIGDGPRQAEKLAKARLMLLGDSYTLGWSVKYTDTFGQALADQLAPDVEVINAAYHAGYSVDAYYAYLVKEGLDLSPDVIVVMLNFADIHDLVSTVWHQVDASGAAIRLGTARQYTDTSGAVITGLPWYYMTPVLRQSYLFVGVSQRLSSIAAKIAKWVKRPVNEATPERALQKFYTALHALKVLARDKRAELIVALIPPHEAALQEWHDGYPRFPRIMDEVGISYIDLKPMITMDDFIGPSDYHFSIKGHRRVASILLETVCAALVRHGPAMPAERCRRLTSPSPSASDLGSTGASP